MDIRVETQDGRTYQLDHIRSEQTREYGKMAQAEVTVPREQVNSIPLTEGDDRVYLHGTPTREDRFIEPPTDIWNPKAGATFDSGNNRAQLHDGNAGEYGHLEYMDAVAADEWRAEVAFGVGEAAGSTPNQDIRLYFHSAEWTQGSVTPDAASGALELRFDYETQTAELWQIHESNPLATFDVTLTPGTTHTAVVEHERGTIRFSLAGQDGQTAFHVPSTYDDHDDLTEDAYYHGSRFICTGHVADGATDAAPAYIHRVRLAYDEFGGVLGEIDRQGSETDLLVDSFERRAMNARPTNGSEQFTEVSADTIIRDALDRTPTLKPGFLSGIADGLSMLFSHDFPAAQVRSATNEVRGEPFYRPNGFVDYYRYPEMQSGQTIAPTNGNIDGGFRVVENSTENRVTHLRVLGSGEGDHQLSTTVVSPTWEEGDPERWDTQPNKDIASETLLQSHAEMLIEEMGRKHVEVETTVTGTWLPKGHIVSVEYPEQDINAELHVVKSTKVVSEKGVQFKATLSNRRYSRSRNSGAKDRNDINNYNTALDGYVMSLGASGGRETIGPGSEYRTQLYYPDDAVDELRMQLHVMGQQYRADVSGVEETVSERVSNSTAVNRGKTIWPPGTTRSVTYGDEAIHNYVPEPPEGDFDGCRMRMTYHNKTSGDHYINWRIVNSEYGGIIFVEEDLFAEEDGWMTNIEEFGNDLVSPGDEVIFDISGYAGSRSGVDHLGSMTFEIESFGGDRTTSHSHTIERGVQQFSQYPSGCYAYVNGTLVTPNTFGRTDAEWSRTFDIKDVLTPGEVNTVRVSTETLGDMQVELDGDVYRQVTEDT